LLHTPNCRIINTAERTYSNYRYVIRQHCCVGIYEQAPRTCTFTLYLEGSALADKFEFGFMESLKTQFEEILVTEEGVGEQATDISVHAFHCSGHGATG
jgi:hypothetical protein